MSRIIPRQFKLPETYTRFGLRHMLKTVCESVLAQDEAIIRQEGDRLIVEPVRKGSLLVLLAGMKPLDETFPDVDESLPPPDDVSFPSSQV